MPRINGNDKHYYKKIYAVLREYPNIRARYLDLKAGGGSSIGDGFRAIGKISRPTEDLALRTLPKSQQIKYDAVSKAIEDTKEKPNGDATLYIIDQIYFKNRKTLEQVAYDIGYSYDGAKDLRNAFVKRVGRYLAKDTQKAEALPNSKQIKK